ncbi:thermonuclease family protein [Methylorubrum sp. POS3]|uniref:thermonuclease family protein n=1 Tax=Methylorubrum sp. POS3 TaxID=2998492 RepID=UPI0037270AF3
MKGSAKAAARSGTEIASPPEMPVSEDDRRIRQIILAELDRRRVRPVARRTLALIAEGFVEPADGLPGYRIVDRFGAVRLRGEGEGAGVPLTIHDLVDELAEQHPALVLPALPPPEPAEPPRDPIADVRAAGARFVETQSALARSLANTSAERSRALASAASETVEGWRHRLAERFRAKARPAPAAPSPVASTTPDFAVPLTTSSSAPPPVGGAANGARFGMALAGPALGGAALRNRLSGGLRTASARSRETAVRLRDWVDDGLAAGSRRPVVLMGLGALAGAALVAALVLTGREDGVGETQSERQASRNAAPQAPAGESAPDAAPTDAAPNAAGTPPPETEQRPAEPPRTANANAVVGAAEVIDTATLRVGGKLVRLFGVEWVRGGQADELAKYLRGRPVTCLPAAGSSAHVCTVEGRDLSEVVLFNGGGRASSEATPELVAAEDHARTERLGVWKR